MIRTILFLAALPALVAAVAGSGTTTGNPTVVNCQPGATTQYIENPDFTGGTNGWSVQYGGNYDTYYGSTPGGTYGYILALNGDHLDDNTISQEVSGLTGGYTYTLSMWWELLPAGTGSCTVSVSLDNIDLGSQTVTSTSDDGVWTQFTATYDASDDSGELAIVLSCTAGSFSSDSEVNFAEITLEGPAQVCSTATLTPTPTPSTIVSTSASVATQFSSSAVNISSFAIRPASSSAVQIASSSSSIGSSFAISIVSSSSAVQGISSTHPPPSSAARPTSSSSAVQIVSSRRCTGHRISSTHPIIGSSSSSIITTSTGTASVSSQLTTDSLSSIPTSSVITISSTTQAASTTPQVTTSTVLSTEVHTITSCAASVTNCPARDRTTFLVTETIVVRTTICPVTATETGSAGTNTHTSVPAEGGSLSNGLPTTRVYTVTATGSGGVPTIYLTTATAPLNAATSSLSTESAGGSGSGAGAAGASPKSNAPASTSTGTVSGGAVPGVASSAHTSSTPVATLHTSSSAGTGTSTEAAGPTYTGGSFSLKVDILSIVLAFMTVLIL